MKGLYISIFVLGTLFSRAQTNLYNKLSFFLNSQTKEVVANRLIAINVWSVSNKPSRQINAEFEKVYKVYEFAKLKGGNKGIIVLNINLDADAVATDITLEKDGIKKSIKVSKENIEIINSLKGKAAGYNVVFDENGTIVYENLVEGTVFSSIQKLITR